MVENIKEFLTRILGEGLTDLEAQERARKQYPHKIVGLGYVQAIRRARKKARETTEHGTPVALTRC